MFQFVPPGSYSITYSSVNDSAVEKTLWVSPFKILSYNSSYITLPTSRGLAFLHRLRRGASTVRQLTNLYNPEDVSPHHYLLGERPHELNFFVIRVSVFASIFKGKNTSGHFAWVRSGIFI